MANKQIGKPYVWGAEGPNAFDCSGLTYYVYKTALGITLPRTSTEQSKTGTTVSRSNLQPGDLIFSSTNGSGSVSHVGIYIGNGQMIHAPKPGDTVKKTNINTTYWNNAYLWAKRYI
ncbi:Probable endopeptidase YafL precursor [uncultured Clostridium sp.]|nr:Probable endopeptidase YafL precursor [uncultured Clostridium sp.]